MFAHKIDDLKFKGKINKGIVFSHSSKISGEKYNYEIIDIVLGNTNINDFIILKNLDNQEDSFKVEPEWFNQRVIKFN